jgi:hypothetical protein
VNCALAAWTSFSAPFCVTSPRCARKTMLCRSRSASTYRSDASSGSGWIAAPSKRYCVSGSTAIVKRGDAVSVFQRAPGPCCAGGAFAAVVLSTTPAAVAAVAGSAPPSPATPSAPAAPLVMRKPRRERGEGGVFFGSWVTSRDGMRGR